ADYPPKPDAIASGAEEAADEPPGQKIQLAETDSNTGLTKRRRTNHRSAAERPFRFPFCSTTPSSFPRWSRQRNRFAECGWIAPSQTRKRDEKAEEKPPLPPEKRSSLAAKSRTAPRPETAHLDTSQ